MPDRRCLVALVCNQPSVFRKTAQSLMELGWGDRIPRAREAHGFSEISHAWFFKSPRVDAMRDMAAEQAVRDGFTHLLFLDADMVWPTDVLEKMLRHHDKGITSGLYIQKHPPYFPIALVDGQPQEAGYTLYQHQQDYGVEPVEVEVVGMGCTLIETRIFEALGPRPWFYYELDGDGWPMVSEDVPFCREARKAGFGVWLDPTVKCGHLMVDMVDERYFRRYQASQRASASASVKAVPVDPKGSAA